MTSASMTTLKKIFRTGCLALLLLSGFGLALAHAQQKPSGEPEVKRDTSSTPGRQFAHGSREAAGTEKDEFAEFKESGSVKMIAKYLTGGNLQRAYWLSIILNFLVIAGRDCLGCEKVPARHVPRPHRSDPRSHAGSGGMESEEARRTSWPTSRHGWRSSMWKLHHAQRRQKEGAAEEARIEAAARKRRAEDLKFGGAGDRRSRQSRATSAHRLCGGSGFGLAQKQIHIDASTHQAAGAESRRPVGIERESGKDRKTNTMASVAEHLCSGLCLTWCCRRIWMWRARLAGFARCASLYSESLDCEGVGESRGSGSAERKLLDAIVHRKASSVRSQPVAVLTITIRALPRAASSSKLEKELDARMGFAEAQVSSAAANSGRREARPRSDRSKRIPGRKSARPTDSMPRRVRRAQWFAWAARFTTVR